MNNHAKKILLALLVGLLMVTLIVKRQITIGSNDKLIFYDLSFVTTD